MDGVLNITDPMTGYREGFSIPFQGWRTLNTMLTILDTSSHDPRTMTVINGTTFDPQSVYLSFESISAVMQGFLTTRWPVGSKHEGRMIPVASSRIFSLRGNRDLCIRAYDDCRREFNSCTAAWYNSNSQPYSAYSFNWADLSS